MAISSAAEPSEIWLATAAVSRPPSVSVFSERIFSQFGSRGPSSKSRPSSGAISASKRPSARARMARSWELDRELLHLLARDVPLLGHRLGADELADLAGAVAGGPTWRTAVRVVEAERLAGVGGRHDRHHAHVLHTAGDDEVHRPRHHCLGGELHGLLGRAALTIDRHAGDVLRQAGREPARPGDAARLRPDRVDVAEHDVVDRVRVDAGAFDQRRDAVGAEVGGMDGGEAPAAAADG